VVGKLKFALAATERQIAEVTRSANEQVRLIASLPPGSRERDAAVTLLCDLNRSIETWNGERRRLFDKILEAGDTSIGSEVRDAVQRRLISDARRWRLKAEELRAAASGMKNASALGSFKRLAENYDVLAEHAEARAEQERATNEGSVR
jgi:hypothetical protein